MANELKGRLDWVGADDVDVQPMNTVMVQGLGDELVLSFGYGAPPIAMATMDAAQMQEYLDEHGVKVRQIVRLSMPLSVAEALSQSIQGTLQARVANVEE